MLQLQMVVGGIYKTLLLQVVQVKSYSQSCLRNLLLLNSIRQACKIQSCDLPTDPMTVNYQNHHHQAKKSKTNAGVRLPQIYHFAFIFFGRTI